MPRWLNSLVAGITTGGLGIALSLMPFGIDFEKNTGLAWLFKNRGAIDPPHEVAVVAINGRAATELGLPVLPRDWPRSIHARLIDKLTAYGASAIVFDMDFQRPREAEHDRIFADAVARSGRVILFERLNGKRQPILDSNGVQTGWLWTEQLIPPIPELAEAAKILAPFPVPKVQVNVFQFWAFKPSAGDVATMPAAALQVYSQPIQQYWLNMLKQAGIDSEYFNIANLQDSMSTLRRAFLTDSLLAENLEHALETNSALDLTVAQERLIKALISLYSGDNNRYLNFYGPPGSIPNIPYDSVINGDPSVDNILDFTGKTVFVGLSDLFDPGQPDRFYTVFTQDYGVDLSGVEIAATAFANLLTDRTLKSTDVITTTAILIAFGVVIGVLVYLLPALLGIPLVVLLTGGYIAVVQYAFNSADVWLPLAIPALVQLPLALFIGLIGQYLLERRRQQRYSKAFRYYLPENAVEELTKKELDPSALESVVYGVCLSTDMSGFTTISEKMAPDALASFMNNYFDTLAQALQQHHVDVTEFHADTIMCAWTAENPDTFEHQPAVLASLAAVNAVRQFNRQVGAELYPRVGLAEGWFYLGHQGGGGRMGYSIVGDCANTAARLESLNKQLDTHILAAQSIVEDNPDILTRPLGRFHLVGKSEMVAICEIVSARESADERQLQLCRLFAEGLELFFEQQWQNAANYFENLQKDYPKDGPINFYLQLCRTYQQQTPALEDLSIVRVDSK